MKTRSTRARATCSIMGSWHNIQMIYEQNSTMKRRQFDDYDPNEWEEDNKHRQKKRRDDKRRRRDDSDTYPPHSQEGYYEEE